MTSRAVVMAVELARRPLLARVMRRHPLPPDVLEVIRIAAGDDDFAAAAGARHRLSVADMRAAAKLYLETVVLSRDSDFYRTLGATPDATQAQLRDHMVWMMRWLHPDRNTDEWASTSAHRVAAAWAVLRSPESRRQYDQERGRQAAAGGVGRRRRLAKPTARLAWVSVASPRPEKASHRHRLILIGIGIVCGLALLIVFYPGEPASVAGASSMIR